MSGDRDLDSAVTDLLSEVGRLLSVSKVDREPVTARVRDAALPIVERTAPAPLDDWLRVLRSVIAAAVLVDYGQQPDLSDTLLAVCQRAVGDHPARQLVLTAQVTIEARRGNWHLVDRLLGHEDPGDRLGGQTPQIAVDLALSAVYGQGDDAARIDDLGEHVRDQPILLFTLASAMFEGAMTHTVEAHRWLHLMEISSAAVMDELGADHPYLGFVLLTLASAKCSHAAIEGNLAELRRCADILAIAVQRASSQLGEQHPHTLGGLANLAHAEFEIALASRSADELTRSLEDLRLLSRRVTAGLGQEHPIAVAVHMNAAVAELEVARITRSSVALEEAARELRTATEQATETFGLLHPRAALAAANAASAEFDLARSHHSVVELAQALEMFERTSWRTENALGENHAVAIVLKRQIQACHALLSAGPKGDERGGGATATIVETRSDELWDVGGDYVSIHQATLLASGSTSQYMRRWMPSDGTLALEALVSTSDAGRRYDGVQSSEHRLICNLCLGTRSLAEIAAHLRLPLGVVRVLVGDMAEAGLVLIHQPELIGGDRPSRELLEQVLDGLRAL